MPTSAVVTPGSNARIESIFGCRFQARLMRRRSLTEDWAASWPCRIEALHITVMLEGLRRF